MAVSPTTVEKLDYSVDIEKATSLTTSTPFTEIIETSTPWDSTTTLATTYGRPDVANLITGVVAKASNDERVLIAACGPRGLMKTVRSTAASSIRTKGPSVQLHCEAFGW